MVDKKCTKCKVVKSLESYYRNRNRNDGRKGACKTCERAATIKRNVNRKKKLGLSYGTNDKLPIIKNFWNMVKDKQKISFTALLNGLSGSGKSTLIVHMMKQLKPHYDLIILVSQNIKADVYNHPVFDIKIHRDDAMKAVDLIRYFQEESNSYLRIIIILDDVVNIKFRYNSSVEDLILNARNIGISTVYSTQTPMLITPNIRKNVHFVFLFRDLDPQSIKSSVDLFLHMFVRLPDKLKNKRERDEWLTQYLYKHTENYNVLVLNKKAKTYDERFSNYRASIPL